MKATGPTIQTVEETGQKSKYDLSELSQTEKDQLEELIDSYKTIKEKIKELVKKGRSGATAVEEGGDNTNLTL